jgi:glycosyltransferase involved in cell wall biosynthesis
VENLSVVIITKNEEENIEKCIKSAVLLTKDIVVVDSGSKDNTITIAKTAGANVISVVWKGFGATRNIGSLHAKNDWILAIDADEIISEELAKSILLVNENDEKIIYGFKRQNYLDKKKIRFGEWGKDKVIRLYSRKFAKWDEAPVHEIIIGKNTQTAYINGYINHYPVKNDKENRIKTLKYAKLNAIKFYKKGKKATLVKRYLSPLFNFFKMYVLLLGFLDGKQGFTIAKYSTIYTWLKYKFLHHLYKD